MSNDCAFIESSFNALKYHPSFPVGGFAELGAARQWVQSFVERCDNDHRHSALKYVAPSQYHTGQAKHILDAPGRVFQKAKVTYPERWSKDMLDFDLPEAVHLNPEKVLKNHKAVNYTL